MIISSFTLFQSPGLQEWIMALVGGLLIGIAVSLMLLWNGRVTGISGIVSGAMTPIKGDLLWRVLFIFGLILGGVVLKIFMPNAFHNTINVSDFTIVVAGLLVGFGALLGGGCTSGHGVCGVSRLAPRSLLATVVFIGAGIFSVFIFKKFGVYL